MVKEEPEQERGSADSTSAVDEPLEPPVPKMPEDMAPDLVVEPEPPAEDEEEVDRMWEASDPFEGEAPTG